MDKYDLFVVNNNYVVDSMWKIARPGNKQEDRSIVNRQENNIRRKVISRKYDRIETCTKGHRYRLKAPIFGEISHKQRHSDEKIVNNL